MSIENCSDSPDALLSLIEEIKLCYQEPPATRRHCRQPDFSEQSFLLLAIVTVVSKTFSDSELHRLLLHDKELCTALGFSRVPHRTRPGKRLKSLRETAEQQIAHLGKTILAEVDTLESQSAVSAIDGRKEIIPLAA